MKKILFFSLVILTVSNIHAQSGSVLLYGDVGFGTTKSNYNGTTSKYTNFDIGPGIGYQFNDHWTAGAWFSYSFQKNPSTVTQNIVAVGPFLRYSIPISNIFSFYSQFDANYQHSSNSPTVTNGFSAQLFPAISANLKNGFALNFSLGGIDFFTGKTKDPTAGNYNSSSFNVGFGSGSSFGISKNFGGKKRK